MPTTLPVQRGIDPAATTPIPRVDTTLCLSARTLNWLAQRPPARALIDSVWDTLTQLQATTPHPGVLAALRFVLIYHQPPTRTGRCPTCPRLSWRQLWRRRPFPCVVWRQVRGELLGHLAASGLHRHRANSSRHLR